MFGTMMILVTDNTGKHQNNTSPLVNWPRCDAKVLFSIGIYSMN